MAQQVKYAAADDLLADGRAIVEYEQQSQIRAEYGKQVQKELAKKLTKEFGKGFSVSNIQFMRRFYQT